jgi:hypothetical protein
MQDAEFKALTDRAGFSLNDAEAADLKVRFEAAIKVIQPLRDIDLGEGDLAVAFSPEPEPNRDRP